MKIGIIGGTGKQGMGLAKYWANDYEIFIGSRNEERGIKGAANLNKELGSKQGNFIEIKGGSNEDASNSDIIVLTIPFDQVEFILSPLKKNIESKIIIDVTVNLKFGKFIKAQSLNGLSSYEFIKERFSDSVIVSAFKTISSTLLAQGKKIDQTNFIQSASHEAFEIVSTLSKIIGLHPMFVKGMNHANTIEGMVALALQLNKEFPGSHFGFKLRGRKSDEKPFGSKTI